MTDERYEPGPYKPPGIGQRLRGEYRALNLWGKVITIVYALFGGLGCLLGGYALTHAYSNWITWSITLFILEPLGVAGLLALGVLAAPDSWLAGVLDGAVRRAWIAASLVGLVFTGGIAWMLIYVLVELFKVWP